MTLSLRYTGKIEPVDCDGIPDLKASSNVVLHLAQNIPNHKNYMLYFDNWFSSISLLDHLSTRGIFCCATIKTARITKMSKNKAAEKQLLTKGQGSYSESKTTNLQNEVTHVQWFDSKIVNLASTFAKPKTQPLEAVQRFSRKERKVADVPRPSIVGLCNQGMGGVDIADCMNHCIEKVLSEVHLSFSRHGPAKTAGIGTKEPNSCKYQSLE